MMGGLVALALLAACGWVAYLLAIQLTGPCAASVRWCAATVVAYWLLIAVFYALAALSLFRLWVAVPLWVAGAGLTHCWLGRHSAATTLLRKDLARTRQLVAGHARSIVGAVFLCVILVVILRILRGLVAPPMAWDALTYHLLKAGRWVQTGAFTPERAPDAWSCYEYFPPFGDILWAWAMLPVRGDGLLVVAGAVVWLSCLLGAYSAARLLGVKERLAALGAVVIGSTPAAIGLLASAYVENFSLALFLLGFVFLHRSVDHGGPGNAALAVAALALAAGVKSNALVFLVLGAALLAVSIMRHQVSWHARCTSIAAGSIAAMILVPLYARAFIETGSPTYPFEVRFGGYTLFAGNPLQSGLLSGRLFPEPLIFRAADLVNALFVPSMSEVIGGVEFTGLGPTAPLILVAGLVGASRLLLLRRNRLAVGYLLAAGAAVVGSLVPADVVALRTFWVDVLSRFLLVPLAVVTVLATAAGSRAADLTLLFGAVINLLFTIPRGWGPTDAHVLSELVPLAGGIGAGLLLANHLRGTWTRRTLLALTAAVVVLLGARVHALRARYRYAYYEQAASQATYDVHLLDVRWASAWPLWEYLDRDAPERLAVTAGWNGVGDNWFRYPLLGTRLQNQIIYVPVTSDGSVVSFPDSAEGKADFLAWLRRLAALQIDYVILLPPDPLEMAWVRDHPDLFRLAASGSHGWGHAYRVERYAVQNLLAHGNSQGR